MQKGFQLVDTDLSDPSVFFTTPNKSRRCPVMVTIGDYNETSVDLQQLLEAGMNIAKLKIAETSTQERAFILERLKEAKQISCRKYDVRYWPVATCVALKNSMVKTGLLESEEEYIEIKEDSEIILTNEDTYYDKCNDKKIYVNNPFLSVDTKIGTEISINSDEILAICTEILDRESIKCVIIKGGFLSNVCDFCTRVENYSRPFITQKDWEIVDFAIEYEIDMIIVNYVTNKQVVEEVKKYIKNKKRPMILSGIATMKGLKNIDDIIKESDGIVLSREFLPYEVSATYRYRLPYIQKWLAAKCFQVGKPLFICGGVFEEALRFGKFRYPQTTDVCNAILDGVSGFILKSCAPSTTLTVKVLKSINEISCFVEPLMMSSSHFMRIIKEVKVPVNAAEAAVIASVMAARQTDSRVIILPTVSGATVRILNWIRPPCLVIAVSSDVRTTRRLHIYRGVTPLLFFKKHQRNWKETLEDQLLYALDYAIKHDRVEYDDTYVSLQRHSQFSSFCDTIVIDKVALGKKRIECPETYEDTTDYGYLKLGNETMRKLQTEFSKNPETQVITAIHKGASGCNYSARRTGCVARTLLTTSANVGI